MANMIRAISAAAGNLGAVAVFLTGRPSETFLSGDRIVSSVLMIAGALRAEVTLETFDIPGTADKVSFVRRIEPFNVPASPPRFSGQITRLATQQNEVGATHLEVFLLSDTLEEVQYLAFDETVQLACFAAAMTARKLSFVANDKVIVFATSTLGHV